MFPLVHIFNGNLKPRQISGNIDYLKSKPDVCNVTDMNPAKPQVKPGNNGRNVKAKKFRPKTDSAMQKSSVKKGTIVSGNPSKQKENAKKKKKNKNKKKPKETKSVLGVSGNATTKLSSGFTMTDITNNAEASKLISDLVSCYTSSLKLSPAELRSLNSSLHQKTASVFMNMLNSCIARVLKKLEESNLSPGLANQKISKKNSSCQTNKSISLTKNCSCLTQTPNRQTKNCCCLTQTPSCQTKNCCCLTQTPSRQTKNCCCLTQTPSRQTKKSSCKTKKSSSLTKNSSCQTKKL